MVLLEDTAALIGLVFAFAGVALSAITGNGRWDGVGSLGIGALLATAAAILAVETKSLLIGESASAEMQRMILAALEEGPGIMRVIHLRTVHVGPDSLLVAGKIAVRETDSAGQVAADINAAEKRVRAAVPIATTIYLEPDIYRPALADQTDPSIRTVLRSRSPHPPAPPVSPVSPISRAATAPRTPEAPQAPQAPQAATSPAPPTPGTSAPGEPSAPGKPSAADEPRPPTPTSPAPPRQPSAADEPSAAEKPSAAENPKERPPPA